MQPILSICIPTYNRQKFLQETLEHLLPQVNDQVEVLVFDNCSTDGTIEYLKSLSASVKVFSQKSNIGADLNMIDCLQGGIGKYIWLLCDDDLPCINAIEQILKGIEEHAPPFLFVTITPSDKVVSHYSDSPSKGGWSVHNRNQFLNRVGCQCTFAGSIIARRDCLQMDFIRRHIGTFLLPAATTLSTVGKYNKVCVSNNPLLFMRTDNSGGYNPFNVFCKNYALLLQNSKKFGYSHSALNRAYEDVLHTVVIPAIDSGRKSGFQGTISLILYTYKFKVFYKKVIYFWLRRMTYEYKYLKFLRTTFNKLR